MAPLIEVVLEGVDAWGGESVNLTPGPYSFRIKEVNVTQKEGKDGKPPTNQLEVTSEVLSGEFSGKQVKSWFMLGGQGDTWRKRLKSLATATSVPTSPNGFDSNALVGCKYNADVQAEEYETPPDPVHGTPGAKRTRTKIINERPYQVLSSTGSAANATGAPVNGGAQSNVNTSVGVAGMPGLTEVK